VFPSIWLTFGIGIYNLPKAVTNSISERLVVPLITLPSNSSKLTLAYFEKNQNNLKQQKIIMQVFLFQKFNNLESTGAT